MKNILALLFLLLLSDVAFSQDLQYTVKGKYSRGVSKEKLSMAKTMSDMRTGYPSSWVHDYTSTEIAVTSKGTLLKAYGVNETLTSEQQSLLQSADIGTDIIVDIGYIYLNPVTQFPDIRKIHFVETVVPEIEAQFPGGYEQLSTYLERNAIDNIHDQFSKEMVMAIIRFTVSETGEVTKAEISKSSNNADIDQLLLRTINLMPLWKPAQDRKGIRISQEFEFTVGNLGC